mgnify:CR=1 FL=1
MSDNNNFRCSIFFADILYDFREINRRFCAKIMIVAIVSTIKCAVVDSHSRIVKLLYHIIPDRTVSIPSMQE